MALPASDAFTDANGTSLTTHNAVWVDVNGSFSIVGNRVNGTAFADQYAYWTGDTFAADQVSKALIYEMVSGAVYSGVCARASGTGGSFNCYVCYTDGASGSGHTAIQKVTGGAGSDLKVLATTFAAGDLMEIRVTGTTTTTIAVYKNSVLVDSVTDSSSPYTSGSPGIYAYSVGAHDNWVGDNLSLGSSSITGVVATGSPGTVTQAHAGSISLTGLAGTGSPGALTAASGQPVSGVAATGSPGTLSASAAGAGSPAITGVAGTGAAAALSPILTEILIQGVSGAASLNTATLALTASVALTGAAVTGSPGTAAANGRAATSPTGISATGFINGASVVTGTTSMAGLTSALGVGAAGVISATAIQAPSITLLTAMGQGFTSKIRTIPEVDSLYDGVSGAEVSGAGSSGSGTRAGVGYGGVSL